MADDARRAVPALDFNEAVVDCQPLAVRTSNHVAVPEGISEGRLLVWKLDELVGTASKFGLFDGARVPGDQGTEPGRHVININLAGRNDQGTVSRKDYDEVCNRIIEDLSRWTDARGNAVVERVVRAREAYSGPFVERASDLYIYWNQTASLGDPPREVQARKFWWSGDHRLDGILISKGPGIRRGAIVNSPVVYDLLPTVMHAAGLPVPAGLDGKVIQELCTDEFLATHPLRADTAAGSLAAERESLTETEEQLIEEKLRSLGYL